MHSLKRLCRVPSPVLPICSPSDDDRELKSWPSKDPGVLSLPSKRQGKKKYVCLSRCRQCMWALYAALKYAIFNRMSPETASATETLSSSIGQLQGAGNSPHHPCSVDHVHAQTLLQPYTSSHLSVAACDLPARRSAHQRGSASAQWWEFWRIHVKLTQTALQVAIQPSEWLV